MAVAYLTSYREIRCRVQCKTQGSLAFRIRIRVELAITFLLVVYLSLRECHFSVVGADDAGLGAGNFFESNSYYIYIF